MTRKIPILLLVLVSFSGCGRQASHSGDVSLDVHLDRGFIREHSQHSWDPFASRQAGGHSSGGSIFTGSSMSGEGALLLIGIVVVVVVVYSVVAVTTTISRGTDVTLLITGESTKEVLPLKWGDNRIPIAKPVMQGLQSGIYTMSLISCGNYNSHQGIPIAETRTLKHNSAMTFAKNGSILIDGRLVSSQAGQ